MTRTSALGRMAVRRPPVAPQGDEAEVLKIADEYRRLLAGVYHARHCRTIELRDEHHPKLFAAMVARELASARIREIERDIKAHHSDVRDRNAVTPAQRAALVGQRAALKEAKDAYAAASKPWKLMFRAASDWWHAQADWKNVKCRDKRISMYATIIWPTDAEPYVAALDAKGRTYDPADLRPALIAAYGRLDMELDLQERELDREFAEALHSAIRAEIKEATQPKLGKDGPGVRYHYGREPELRPWEKLSLHFAGGLTVADALAGKSRQLRLTQYDETLYGVVQQIGTAREPRELKYAIAPADLPHDTAIMRWSHVTRQRETRSGRRVYRRYVTPVCAGLPLRETGHGVCAYKLCWTRTRDGVMVARLWGSDGYYERLIVPQWVLNRISAVSDLQAFWDLQANDLLASRGVTPGRRQGVEALQDYVAADGDRESRTLLEDAERALQLASNDARRARGCIDEIYKVTAAKLRTRYAAIVHDNIDLAKLKRYDARDLLREDKLPLASREILHAVSPGKLRRRLKQGGLPASDEAPPEPPGDAREDCWLMVYVRSLGIKTGRREAPTEGRSQTSAAALAR